MASKYTSRKVLSRRLACLVFAMTFFAFAYFHQGGGWNQNARFAMVRAIVEEGTLSIDSYLIYTRAEFGPGMALVRRPLHNGEFFIGEQANLLGWTNSDGQFFPVSSSLEGRIIDVDPSRKIIAVQLGKNAIAGVAVSEGTRIERAQRALSFHALNVGEAVQVNWSRDQSGRPFAKTINLTTPDNVRDRAFKDIRTVAASGDISYAMGHFHPNKAPGASFLAVPAYWLLYHMERMAGANPDHWWILTLNAWLTSVFSVGLISAIGVVLVYRLALAFSGGRAVASFLTSCAFAYGTMFFPNATLLYEHNLIAVGLIASFYFLYHAKSTPDAERQVCLHATTHAKRYLFFAGLCAGYAAIINYIAAMVVIFLALYLVLVVRRKNGWIWFGLGLIGPFLAICAYNIACFGTPVTTNYRYQNPFFTGDASAFLGVFVAPQWSVLPTILFSPFRGLFFSSPVLLVGLIGLVPMFRDKSFRAEAWLLAATIAFFLLFNVSFNGWTGGDTTVPRYLGPAIPFLAVPVVFGFMRLFKTTCLLALVSIGIMLLTTAVDPQPPISSAGPDRPQWRYNPVTEYELPLFLSNRPWPLLGRQADEILEYYEQRLANENSTPEARQEELRKLQDYIEDLIGAKESAPVLATPSGTNPTAQQIVLSRFRLVTGPVSVNPGGTYGGWSDGLFGSPGSEQARWNSFNIGEFLFLQQRLSLLPLLFGCGLIGFFAFRAAQKMDAACRSDRAEGLVPQRAALG